MQPEDCPVEQVLTAVGTKWTPMVVLLLAPGTRRFGELRRALPGLSPRVLTDRLRTLELLGLVTRTVYAEVPPRVDYGLTGRGVELVEMLERIALWAAPADPSADPPAPRRPGLPALPRLAPPRSAAPDRPHPHRAAVVALGDRAPTVRVSAEPYQGARPPSAPRRPAGPAA